jgi:high affinity Mn2+ porin
MSASSFLAALAGAGLALLAAAIPTPSWADATAVPTAADPSHSRPGDAGIAADAIPPAPAEELDVPSSEDWSLHTQATGIYQAYPSFHSPYQGSNSLSGNTQIRDTLSFTGFVGYRLPWQGGELYFNPEFNQGSGFDHTFGIAGFPNGEAQKASSNLPKFNVARLFLRQTFGLGGEQETLEADANQLAETVDVSRITVTIGKLSIPDLFDGNAYSHDPRTQFLNWSLMDGGAYDYAADQKGYSDGIAVELNQKLWALRVGYFLVPKMSNDRDLETRIAQFGGYNAELETRYSLDGQPGKFRILGFANRIFAGSYRETLADPALDLNIAATRRERLKYGFVLNLEQAVTSDLGLFSRYSWNDGKEEIMSFTDITESFSLGASLKGTNWDRPDDVVGLAGVVNFLSAAERDFLAAGGLGILIGDGRLNYAPEGIVEAYYNYKIAAPLSLTLDYQFFDNPAYNQDRGPVSVFTARLHAAF